MTYPELHAAVRTDVDFLTRRDEEHHLTKMVSPLLDLNIGLVSQFPLDYMHLVCLGIVRRLISLWTKGDLKYRQPAKVVNNISANLLSLRCNLPREYARRSISLLEYKQWKATEFRQFLLYSGAVVLHNILPVHMYNNFLTLSVAMTFLLRSELASNFQYCAYAEKLLLKFSTDFAAI